MADLPMWFCQTQSSTTTGVSSAAGSLQLPEGPAIAFRNLKNAKVC